MEFRRIDRTAEKDFAPFFLKNRFADTTYALLYAWGDKFLYSYCKCSSGLIVKGTGMNQREAYILIHDKEDEQMITDGIEQLYRYHSSNVGPLIFEYVGEEEIESYRTAAARFNCGIQITTEEIYDDYIYDTEEFLSISGKKNRGKRYDVNHLKNSHPEMCALRYEDVRPESCMEIFDRWCERHSCSDCYFGCEREAFQRFMSIYDRSRHYIMVSCEGERAVSFAVCEQINEDTVGYYIQKNAEKVRGLTYWLNRQMAFEHEQIAYINLAEDMGIPGIVMDKSSLHPCRKQKKYTVEIVEGGIDE